MLCHSKKHRGLWSEWIIYFFHLWKEHVDSSNVIKYKQNENAAFQRRNFILKKYLLQVLAITPIILLKCPQQPFNAFSEKYFVQYNLIVKLKYFYHRSLSVIRSNVVFCRAIRTPPKVTILAIYGRKHTEWSPIRSVIIRQKRRKGKFALK